MYLHRRSASNGSLSRGAIAGIATAAIVFSIILALGAIVYWRTKNAASEREYNGGDYQRQRKPFPSRPWSASSDNSELEDVDAGDWRLIYPVDSTLTYIMRLVEVDAAMIRPTHLDLMEAVQNAVETRHECMETMRA